MQRYIIVLLWILILAVILLSVPTKCALGGKEPFTTYYGYFKKYCPSCNWRGRKNCGSCTNCIYGVTNDGYGKCIPGDSNGPFFDTDLLYFEYGDPYTYQSGSNVYPIVKQRNVYPYTKWNWWRNRLSKRGKRLA